MDIEKVTADLRGIIQRTYGDATQTVLDDRCARAVVEYLTVQGWAPPDVVAAMVAAAGGRIDLPDAVLAEDHVVESAPMLHPPGLTLRARALTAR